MTEHHRHNDVLEIEEDSLFKRKLPKLQTLGLVITIVFTCATFCLGYYTSNLTQNVTQDTQIKSLREDIKNKVSRDEFKLLVDQQKETNQRLEVITTILMQGNINTKKGNR